MSHILIILRPSGGIRTYCKYLYKKTEFSKYRFTVLAPEWDESYRLSKELYGINAKYKFSRTIAPYNKLNFMAVAKEILQGKYDLIHSHGYTAGLFSALPAFFTHTPHIMTGHDIFRTEEFTGFGGKLKKKLINFLFNLITMIHCVSEDAAKNFVEYFPDSKNKIKIIEHGIETANFIHCDAKDLRISHSANKNTFLIGYFGRYMPQKGFGYLIEAVAQIIQRGVSRKPLMLCWGDGGYLNDYKSIISQKGLNDYFKFLPFEEDVGPSIKGLDVVVMPSLWEAFGLLAIETLIAGTPLIASDCPGLKCTLANTAATAVPMGDSPALANALVMEMTTSTRSKVTANRDYLMYRFDIRRVAAEIDRVYQALISRQHP